MTSLLIRLAVTCVRGWTWLYTWRMPLELRETRRAEIESDLWECQSDAAEDPRLGAPFQILLRLLIGIPDDLGWRVEQAAAVSRLTQGGIAFGGRLAGAAFVIGMLGIINIDIHRPRAPVAVEGLSTVFAPQIEEPMTMRGGSAPDAAGRGLPLLTAGIIATVSMLPRFAPPSPPMAAGGPIFAQAPSAAAPTPVDPAFEAASVKPNRSGDARSSLVPQPGGRLTATNVTAAALVRFAYELPDFQVFGGPAWLSSDRFDVVAKAEGDPPLTQRRLMLRRLLAERFRLTAHTEVRELPIYALVMARSDGKTGPQLRRTETDCARVETPADPGVGFSPRNGPSPCGFFGFAPGTDLPSGRGGLAFRGLTMVALAKTLVPIVRRSVSDQTGLAGYFDAEFEFIAELPLPPPPPGVPAPERAPFPSVFTVLTEQLGLKLDARRGPVEVLVIDRAERPTPN